ncbi:MAG: ATP-grasp domain-containing protein [Magnetococcales bacterium]|nr:ATP-grasp domain-containing protein [Magnetococcales bacterium]MBF0115674.1 ATP-grasp domain-containing protein [Magnetococcales bacterium]
MGVDTFVGFGRGMSEQDKKERWLVAVTAGRWQMHGIRMAQRAGLRVFAVDGSDDAPGLAIADHAMVVDARSPQAVVEAVRGSGIEPSGAIAFVSEVGMLPASAVREQWRLPGHDSGVVRRLLDKQLQRELWDQAGVPSPQWRRAGSLAEVQTAVAELGLPVIIKPVDCAGSRGVTRVESKMEIADAVQKALSATRSGRLLVESFMEGVEYAVETFFHQGVAHVLAVTGKKKVPGSRGTVAMELATPDLPAAVVEKIGMTAVQALTALGYRDGPGHTEIILQSGDRPGLVETAGRGGGFMVFDAMAQMASGYDLPTACALQAVGLPPPSCVVDRQAVVLRFFPTVPGTVRRLDGFDEANRLPGVVTGSFMTVGSVVGVASCDGDRLGFILSRAATPAQAQTLADTAEAMIHIEIS